MIKLDFFFFWYWCKNVFTLFEAILLFPRSWPSKIKIVLVLLLHYPYQIKQFLDSKSNLLSLHENHFEKYLFMIIQIIALNISHHNYMTMK